MIERNEIILTAAVDISKEVGYLTTTRDAVAKRAGVSQGTVNNAYGTMDELRCEVLKYAIRNEILPIIAQGLAAGSHICVSAPQELKTRALATLA
jgi:AcrR family transcriptional regulator